MSRFEYFGQCGGTIVTDKEIAPFGAFVVDTQIDTSKEVFKESMYNLDYMEPNQLDVVAKEATRKARKKRRQKVKDSGKTPKKKITAQDCTANLVHMLNGATLEETIAFANEGKPEGWFDSVKNDELPNFVRKEVVGDLRQRVNSKGDDHLSLLKHMLENDYTSFNEIQKIDTHNNQLKQVSKLITMSDRISALEKQVDELRSFKDTQLMFNSLVVSQMEYQHDMVVRLEDSVSTLCKKDRMIEYQKRVNQISNTKSQIEYLLSVDLSKKEISEMLDIPYRTLMRRLKEYNLT